jgi:hypothetical protein
VDKIVHIVADIATTAHNWLMYNPDEVYYICRLKSFIVIVDVNIWPNLYITNWLTRANNMKTTNPSATRLDMIQFKNIMKVCLCNNSIKQQSSFRIH